MSARGQREPHLRGYVRNSRRRKMVLDVDLNVLPRENRDQTGISVHASSQDLQAGVGNPARSVPIDVEALDDDIVISSPRAFAEAKNNSRRNCRRPIVVDVDSVERTYVRTKRRRIAGDQAVINCDLINLDSSSSATVLIEVSNENGQSGSLSASPQPPPVPKEPTFSCPVCMGTLEEEMSTKCGHIFCKKCIRAAINAQGKCPTCRRKVTMKDILRIYLPATN